MVKPSIKSSSESQNLLRALSHCKPKIRNAILKNCQNDLIHIIYDCVYNVVKGNVPGLTQQKVHKLARHKTSHIKLTKMFPSKKRERFSFRKEVDFFHFYFPSLLP